MKKKLKNKTKVTQFLHRRRLSVVYFATIESTSLHSKLESVEMLILSRYPLISNLIRTTEVNRRFDFDWESVDFS